MVWGVFGCFWVFLAASGSKSTLRKLEKVPKMVNIDQNRPKIGGWVVLRAWRVVWRIPDDIWGGLGWFAVFQGVFGCFWSFLAVTASKNVLRRDENVHNWSNSAKNRWVGWVGVGGGGLGWLIMMFGVFWGGLGCLKGFLVVFGRFWQLLRPKTSIAETKMSKMGQIWSSMAQKVIFQKSFLDPFRAVWGCFGVVLSIFDHF